MPATSPRQLQLLKEELKGEIELLEPASRGIYALALTGLSLVTAVSAAALLTVIPIAGFIAIAAILIKLLDVSDGIAMLGGFIFLSACVPFGYVGVPSLYRRARAWLLKAASRFVRRSLRVGAVTGGATSVAMPAGGDEPQRSLDAARPPAVSRDVFGVEKARAHRDVDVDHSMGAGVRRR